MRGTRPDHHHQVNLLVNGLAGIHRVGFGVAGFRLI
jgi:hypothetical protein